MLEYLKLRDVGPAPSFEMELAPRLNFLTGDNGLGKSFLLDVAWFALTGKWWGHAAVARRGGDAHIEYSLDGCRLTHDYIPKHQAWRPISHTRATVPRLVVYALADGGFAIWDSVRNLAPGLPDNFVFAPASVWDGLQRGSTPLCNGLIHDWASWQRGQSHTFARLVRVLDALSPSPHEPIVPGSLTRVALDDIRDHATLRMPYGQEVPLIYASAAIRRIVAFAYMLVWTWEEHLRACELLQQTAAREIVFLVDELEAHLHPQWQRRIVPALLDVMSALAEASVVEVQLVAATHSPLVLASVEPDFDEEKDAVFHLDLVEGEVTLERMPWSKQGDVTNWLVSEVFGLRQARSLEAERVIEAAEAIMRGDTAALPEGLTRRDAIHQELCRVLPGHDPFWPRWVVWTERQHDAESQP